MNLGAHPDEKQASIVVVYFVHDKVIGQEHPPPPPPKKKKKKKKLVRGGVRGWEGRREGGVGGEERQYVLCLSPESRKVQSVEY